MIDLQASPPHDIRLASVMEKRYPSGHASAAQGGYREKNIGRITAAASNSAAGPADRPTRSVVLKKLPPTSAAARRYAGRYSETGLRQQVKAAGGIWDAQNKLWRLPKSVIRKLKLEQRVVAEHA